MFFLLPFFRSRGLLSRLLSLALSHEHAFPSLFFLLPPDRTHMLSLLARRVARRAGGEAVAFVDATRPLTTSSSSSAAEIIIANASSSPLLLLRSCFSSSALASTSGAASSSLTVPASGIASTSFFVRRFSAAAFFADLTLPSSSSTPAPPPPLPNPVGAASHLKAALKPRQGRNRFARAWRRQAETMADARRRKHETSVALAVRDAKRRRRWAAAGAAARGVDGEIL